MLVLTRKVGEQVVIGDEITVTVLDVRRDGIKIGIDAPRHVRVQRQELILAVADENLDSARSSPEGEAALISLLGAVASAEPHEVGREDEHEGPPDPDGEIPGADREPESS
ncbi:carbon storage regulator CsrA [Nesterenkonia sp. NBAIMH1]|uniref:carbon storage regulator CsrA n=1 Tax=Nesterenkonia sp. NBAIMH1 TaxID=2600320 RepID=UPI0011B511C3|nr:carbon storage regulator CsrA [Nesterenkonia sp. NBAIMH1]